MLTSLCHIKEEGKSFVRISQDSENNLKRIMEFCNSFNKYFSNSKLEINFVTTKDEPAVREFISFMFRELRRDYSSFHFRQFCKSFRLWVIILFIMLVTYIMTFDIFMSVSLGMITGCSIGFSAAWLLLHRVHNKAYPWSDRLLSDPYSWTNENNHRLLLGKIDGHLVATTLIKRNLNDATEIARMYVRKDARCCGIGKLMMKKCFDVLRKEGDGFAYLINDVYNVKARKFYIRNGFSVCSPRVYAEVFPFKVFYYRMEIDLLKPYL
ncbi:uncharacterized protein LOC143228107 isoform X2 [Tachypleus tridentatus]|uniref:uncharacterized protein LOC143228107 isoform X2 n=1 Tax=Tachypleus tridentatus TaxID=6853 RepID=UPI003FD44B4E